MYPSEVVWAACLRLVSSHEADILWECDVGHIFLQQAEGRCNLQSILPSHPKSR